MTQWYYANSNDETQGPVAASVIREKLARGELKPSNLVWCEGMAEWQPLSSVQVQLAATDTPGNAPPSPGVPPSAPKTNPESASPYTAPSSTLSVGDGSIANVGGEIVHAGFWKRVAANVIDGLLVNVVGFAMMVALWPLFGVSAMSMLGFPERGLAHPDMDIVSLTYIELIVQLVMMALTIAYLAWFHSSQYMATLGKMAVGIKVVRTDGTPITLARGIGRYFAFLLSWFTMGVGLVMAAFTGRKQALHDMICDTLVVDKWAFTDRPDLQQKGLGPVTIIVLVLFGLFLAFVILMTIISVGMLISQGRGGNWR